MSRENRVIDPAHPKSRLGTPQHTGPYARLRLDTAVKLDQGAAVYALLLRGLSIRAAARALGLSRMTAWRRVWFFADFHAGGGDPIPHQRSTRAVPRGEPWLLPRDAEKMLRRLLDSGPEISADVVFASVATVPRCVRGQALRVLVSERMAPEEFERFEARLAERARALPAPPSGVCVPPDVVSRANRARL